MTFVLTLEILRFSLISRWITGAIFFCIWATVCSQEEKIGSILLAMIYQGIQRPNIKRRRGAPRSRHSQKIRSWIRFWIQVMVWASSICSTTEAFKFVGKMNQPPTWITSTVRDHGLVLRAQSIYDKNTIIRDTGIAVSVISGLSMYHELYEVVVTIYLFNQKIVYTWGQRIVLWGFSACFGTVYLNGLFVKAIRHVLMYTSAMTVLETLIVIMIISICMTWYSDTKHKAYRVHRGLTIITTSECRAVRTPKTPKTKTPTSQLRRIHSMKTRSRLSERTIGVQAA